LALVFVKEGPDTKVRLSTGVAGEEFAGVSFSRNTPPSVLPYVADGVVDANHKLAIPRQPITGQVLVKINGTKATVVAAAPAGATEVQFTPGAAVFHTSVTEGTPVSIQMLYSPTVTEARSIVGDAPIGGLSSIAQSSVGVLKNAVIGTNSFDASVDWSNALYVKLLAAGVFTIGTQADHVPGVIVKSSPSAANPFLVLEMNVA
jgi:hypothetical protein